MMTRAAVARSARRILPAFLLLPCLCPGQARVAAADQLTASATVHGLYKLQRVGYAVSGSGDVNGDGFADYAVGSPHTSVTTLPGVADVGAVFLFLGKSGRTFGSGSVYEHSNAIFWGRTLGDAVGSSKLRGDVNGDGLSDILIGAPARTDYAPDNPGHFYVVLGRGAADWGKNRVLDTSADASYSGEGAGYSLGYSLDYAGDVNADGYGDFMVSQPFGPGLKAGSGKVFFFLGKAGGWQRNASPATATAVFMGNQDTGRAGGNVQGVGDVNGDGVPDMAVSGSGGAGRVYLIFGRTAVDWGASFNLDNADVIFWGENSGDNAGFRIGRAGDVNADGFADFLVTAPLLGSERGKVYLILGKTSGWSKSASLSSADASFLGENEWDNAGWSASGGGDINGDGYSDFLIGALNTLNGSVRSGKAYLLYGMAGGWAPNTGLGTIEDVFAGTASDEIGHAVATLGDVNRDGSSDYAITAPRSDMGEEDAGKVCLFLGPRLLFNIQGSVLGVSGSPVCNASIKVNGDSVAALSGAQGLYTVIARQGRNYTLAPAKLFEEDVGDTVLTSYDAALAARHAAGIEALSGGALEAADADHSGTVRMNDAVEIARYAVGLKSGSSERAGAWFFDPAQLAVTDVQQDISGRNFTARVRGDVNGSWNGGLSKACSPAGWDCSILIRDGVIEMNLTAESQEPFFSMDAVIEYDGGAFAFAGMVFGESDAAWNAFSSDRNGSLRIGAFTVGPARGRELFRLQWRVQDRAGAGAKPFVLKRLCLNDVRIARNEVLQTGVNQAQKPDDFSIEANFPNPFNPSTDFRVTAGRPGFFTVEVLNQRGETVKQLWNGMMGAGRHLFRWDGKDDSSGPAASGLYLLRVSSGDSNKCLKALLVR